LDVIAGSIIGSLSTVANQCTGIGRAAARVADAAHRILDSCIIKASIETDNLFGVEDSVGFEEGNIPSDLGAGLRRLGAKERARP
jgi:hypothetical protein